MPYCRRRDLLRAIRSPRASAHGRDIGGLGDHRVDEWRRRDEHDAVASGARNLAIPDLTPRHFFQLHEPAPSGQRPFAASSTAWKDEDWNVRFAYRP